MCPRTAKLRTLSDLGLKKSSSIQKKIKPTIDPNQDYRRGFEKLMEWNLYWDQLSESRKRRARVRDYVLGKQWGDPVVDPQTGQTITEEEYIKNQGRVPLVNNQMQQVEKNIVGQFRQNQPKSIVIARAREKQSVSEMLQNAQEAAKTLIKSEVLDVANLREFLMSGAAISRIGYGYQRNLNRSEVKCHNIHFNRVFFNTDLEDPRQEDITVIGHFMDLPLNKIVGSFALNEADEKIIRNWYERHSLEGVIENDLKSSRFDSMGFFDIPNNDKARVFEGWELKGEWRLKIHDPATATYDSKKESTEIYSYIERENSERMEKYIALGFPMEEIPLISYSRIFEEFWYYYYITPGGNILKEGECPYMHEEHPFTITLFPLIDGEVKGFLADIIDQQRYINRLIILIDFMISASAKGVLLVPEDCIPEGMDIDDFAQEWSKFNGVIKIKVKPGATLPKQISANNTNIGAFELLSMQFSLFNQISGVSESMQGQRAAPGTPASRYAMEAQNSSINLVNVFRSYMQHIGSRDEKLLKTIIQFYDDERYIGINGSAYSEEAKEYRPYEAKSFHYDMKVVEGTSTPVYRQMQDDLLFKLYDSHGIDVKMLLANSSIPMADKLLDQIEKRENSINAGEPVGLDPNVVQEFQEQVQQQNPKGMQMLQNMMEGFGASV